MRRLLLLTAVAALPAAAPAPKADSRPDRDKLQGTWVLAAVMKDGSLHDIPAEAQTLRWAFDGDRVQIAGPAERKAGTYALDPPHRALDLSLAAPTGRAGGAPLRLLYLVDRDTLQVCIDNDNSAQRPCTFVTRDTRWSLMIFRRERPDDPKVLAARRELEKLEGSWELVAVERKGKPETIVKAEYVFKGQQISLYFDGKEAGTVTFLFDPVASPRHISIPVAGSYVPSIYVVEGDTLKICSAGPGEERPTTFTTDAASGRMLTVLRRKPR